MNNATKLGIQGMCKLGRIGLVLLAVGTAGGEEPDPTITKMLDERGLQYKVDEKNGNITLTFKVGEGERTHMVTIQSSTMTYKDLEVRQVYGLGYVAPEGTDRVPTPVMRALLVQNGTIKLGAWEMSDDGRVAIFTVRLHAKANIDELVSAIDAVIDTADEMELKLTNKDDL